ncbi:MAG: hypothetical protein H7145_16845 [Akkermansiaceae bacterium]|nr:hypothetical protein [Armatimonadota bacterium]
MRDNTPWRDIVTIVGAVILTGFAGSVLAKSTAPLVEVRSAGMSPQMQERLEESASTSLFGQFRSSAADFLWLKVDKYLHNGVELRGLTEQEKTKQDADAVRTASEDVASGFKQHEEETTIIPSAKSDWRGVIGDVERAVQPYEDMSNHKHRDPQEALPLFRLMTASNPQFIPGYVYGAAMIARNKTKYPEAIAFLKEGEVNNPQSIEIKTEMGMFYDAKTREFNKAVQPLQEAIVIGSRRDPATLSDDEKEAWQNAYRWLVLSYRYQGEREKAHQFAVAGLKLFPGDATCRMQMEIERAGTWRKYIATPGAAPK